MSGVVDSLAWSDPDLRQGPTFFDRNLCTFYAVFYAKLSTHL